MKKLYLLFVILLATFAVNAQNIYFNNFDTYTAGVYAAQTMGSPWTTWSNAPGGAEDGHIVSTHAYSSPNSVGIILNNDLVMNLNDKTSGRYKIEFYMYVATDSLGYFNVLSDFNGSSSIWGFQVYIYNDSIFVDAGGTTAAKTTFAFDAWNKMDLIVDLDDDFATFMINANEIISYQWSKGAQGTGSTNKLDAIDFFGWDGTGAPTTATGTAGYFIDDISIDQLTPPDPPMSLTATLNGGNIDVTWSAPGTSTPDLYKLSRNGSVVYGGTNLSYTDVGPWPNDYGFGARAYYSGLGYSHSSNIDSVTVPNGCTRDLVLMEGGTGTWCTYCPGAAMGLRDMIETNQKNAVAVEYHSGDTYENPSALTRIGYYNISGFPTVFADGKLSVVGGSATVSMYSSYLPMYNERIGTPSLHTMDISIVEDSANYYTATITVTQTFDYASGWKLQTALTESNIAETWGNQTEVDFACRGMFPSATGTAMDFSSQPTQVVTIPFSTVGYAKDNCEFVAFIQHNATKEVTQTAKVDISSVVGIDEIQGKTVSIWPNPAQDYIVLNSNGNGKMEIIDMTGKTVFTSEISKVTQLFDVRNFVKGIYIVKVTSDTNTLTKKIIIE